LKAFWQKYQPNKEKHQIFQNLCIRNTFPKRELEIQDNIQWHPAFCSAVELELRDHKQCLTYEREHNPGRMPLKIDLLIIKKRHDIVIKNDIADFFLGNNILEYKSPGDDVNAGTFTRRCVWEAG
jgi:hypothetical protein